MVNNVRKSQMISHYLIYALIPSKQIRSLVFPEENWIIRIIFKPNTTLFVVFHRKHAKLTQVLLS